jgi:surface protein
MFYAASAINQDISGWNVSQANDMTNMFRYADAFSKCNTMALDTSDRTPKVAPCAEARVGYKRTLLEVHLVES